MHSHTHKSGKIGTKILIAVFLMELLMLLLSSFGLPVLSGLKKIILKYSFYNINE